MRSIFHSSAINAQVHTSIPFQCVKILETAKDKGDETVNSACAITLAVFQRFHPHARYKCCLFRSIPSSNVHHLPHHQTSRGGTLLFLCTRLYLSSLPIIPAYKFNLHAHTGTKYSAVFFGGLLWVSSFSVHDVLSCRIGGRSSSIALIHAPKHAHANTRIDTCHIRTMP